MRGYAGIAKRTVKPDAELRGVSADDVILLPTVAAQRAPFRSLSNSLRLLLCAWPVALTFVPMRCAERAPIEDLTVVQSYIVYGAEVVHEFAQVHALLFCTVRRRSLMPLVILLRLVDVQPDVFLQAQRHDLRPTRRRQALAHKIVAPIGIRRRTSATCPRC